MARVRPDVPRTKRAGLDLDLPAVCAAGPAALAPDDHYRLKTYGVCAQRHDDLFMVRLRVPGGRLDATQVAAVTEAARRYAGGWVHLTTRQNIELHSVALGDVPAIHELLRPAGLVGRSACGHTIRNITACPGAATFADEPFDVTPDARWLSSRLVARSSELNVALPSRLNISVGGCTDCGLEALTNDIGLVACLRGSEPGYQVWAGGSLGSAPRLAIVLRPFITRQQLWPAVWSIVEWFLTEGSIDDVAKGRLKFVVEALGEPAFRQGFAKRFAHLCGEPLPSPLPDLAVPEPSDVGQALARAPMLGWRDGIRPERRPGRASITVRAPLGDLLGDELDRIVALAPDGVVLTREQNVLLTGVAIDEVPAVVGRLADLGLGPAGARGSVDVRACPGLAFCSLAITGSQPVALAVERALSERPDLPRDVSIAVSGCPNSCTKHQVADVGFAGVKVRAKGRVALGYQVFLGADLPSGLVGRPVIRVLEEEVADAVTAVIETWVATRRAGEHPGRTFRRVGLELVAGAVESRLRSVGWGDRPAEALEMSAV